MNWKLKHPLKLIGEGDPFWIGFNGPFDNDRDIVQK